MPSQNTTTLSITEDISTVYGNNERWTLVPTSIFNGYDEHYYIRNFLTSPYLHYNNGTVCLHVKIFDAVPNPNEEIVDPCAFSIQSGSESIFIYKLFHGRSH